MPKSSKKKKDKAADFSKAKLKLGKGKQTPTNVVDTSFKARSIALPSQSISHNTQDATPTTRRKLTFDDLTSHLKHYNANTRKDAIFGLRELLEEHPALIDLHLTAIVNSCVRLIGDEDAGVRKSLLSFMSWFLSRVPQEDILPHSPLLLLFTTSAQTHIFPEIRVDAVRFLDLYLEHIPTVVTQGWAQGTSGHGKRVLEGYIGLLNAGTVYGEGGDKGPIQATSTASVVLSPTSKLVVLRSLARFLEHALSISSNSTVIHGATQTIPTWFFSSSLRSEEAFSNFDSLLQPASTSKDTRLWEPEFDIDSSNDDYVVSGVSRKTPSPWSLHDLSDINLEDIRSNNDNLAGESSMEYAYIMHLARVLQSTLISTFLDCAPTAFHPSGQSSETELNMVVTVSEIVRRLYATILQRAAKNGKSRDISLEDLSAFIGHMSPYFPFSTYGSLASKRDIKVEQAFQDLNVVYSELTSLLVLAATSESTSSSSRTTRNQRKHPGSKNKSTTLAVPSSQVDRVTQYVVHLLRGELPTGTNTQNALPRPVTSASYIALIPTIWALINDQNLSRSLDLLNAVVDHATNTSSTSSVKRHTLEFLGRLVLLESEPSVQPNIQRTFLASGSKIYRDWILHLPKTAWELGANNLPSTEIIFRLLLRLIQRRSSIIDLETLNGIRTRLVPYFMITHPTRGKLPGPFTKLPIGSITRRLALDLVSTMCTFATFRSEHVDGDGHDQTDPLVIAVNEATNDTIDEAYWISVSTKQHL
ncbi:Pre-rRNA-processing protein IPI1 [Abortiporus biennis]